MAASGKRQAPRRSSGRGFRLLGWLPEVVVVLVVLAAGLQVQFDLGHRWFGLERADPRTNPGGVPAPEGLDLAAGPPEPAVLGTLVPGAVDRAAVRRALSGVLAENELGPGVALRVVDLATGEPVLTRNAEAVTPASTMKLLTSAAALSVLGPATRFSTRVLAGGPDGTDLVLLGGGDPYLVSRPAAPGSDTFPPRADLQTLARRTATALAQKGVTAVRLGYDARAFTGPAVNPRWPETYVPENVVPPITALWVDQGLDPEGGYVEDPARAAAQTFAAALSERGVSVSEPVRRRATGTELARVQGPRVAEIVEQVLAVSDNNAAEVLARHIGQATNGDASFEGGMRGVIEVLDGLGVEVAGALAYDGSGLSRQNRLTTRTLADVLQLAASPDHPELRGVISALPVAGFNGSLGGRFDRGPEAAAGRVRAKTGTLTGVHALAGVATDLDGNAMVFVVVADGVSVDGREAAQRDLDRLAAALAVCRCGR